MGLYLEYIEDSNNSVIQRQTSVRRAKRSEQTVHKIEYTDHQEKKKDGQHH